MKRSWPLLLGIAAVVFALDLWTKRWASATLQFHAPVEILGEFVRLTYTRNSGIAFGIGAGVKFPYYLFSIVASLLIVYLFARQRDQSPMRQTALALILGGALGNLLDRVTTGEVVDFIEIGWNAWHWPVFNVADSAVTVGVLLFGLTWMHHGDGHAVAATSEREGSESLADEQLDEPNAGPVGARDQRRGAAGSLPGRGADRPLP